MAAKKNSTLRKTTKPGRVITLPDRRTKYRARPGAHINDKDAQVIGRFMDGLVRRHGTVTPEVFVEAAAQDDKIRDYLEWDDTRAAEKFRLQQARVLMGSISVVVSKDEREVEVRGFSYVDSHKGYLPAARIYNDAPMLAQVALRAKRDAIAWFHRYQNIRKSAGELSPLFDQIDQLIEEEAAEMKAAAE